LYLSNCHPLEFARDAAVKVRYRVPARPHSTQFCTATTRIEAVWYRASIAISIEIWRRTATLSSQQIASGDATRRSPRSRCGPMVGDLRPKATSCEALPPPGGCPRFAAHDADCRGPRLRKTRFVEGLGTAQI